MSFKFKISKTHIIVLVVVLILIILFLLGQFSRNKHDIYLYAWERPEDFSFLTENNKTSVVFYTGSIVIENGEAIITPRINSLFIPKNIESIPLVRIDSFDTPRSLNNNLLEMADFIVKICSSHKVCQIDFEARTSEYEFYSDLLENIHKSMPGTEISVTALASWCSSENNWLNDSSASEVIPMFYRMGKDSTRIKSGDVGKWFLSNPRCDKSIALSTDELDFDSSRYTKGKSIYLFNPKSWTKESLEKALAYLEI